MLQLTEEDSAGQLEVRGIKGTDEKQFLQINRKKKLERKSFWRNQQPLTKVTQRQMMRRWRRADEVIEACRKEW